MPYKDPDKAREYNTAKHREYSQTEASHAYHRDYMREYSKTAFNRSLMFLRGCRRDGRPCTSTREEIIAIFESRLDWRGNPLVPGERYHLDHLPNGPAIGMVPHYINKALMDEIVAHWEEFLAYAKFSRGLEV